MTSSPQRSPRILVAHPFPDVYGADRVLLDAIMGLRDNGMDPTVVLPEAGPMMAWLDDQGIGYRCVATPVLRRALLRPAGLLSLARHGRRDLSLVRHAVASLEPDLVYVNTLTLPYWVLGAKHAKIPVLVHVHESDERIHPVIAAGIAAPLMAADRIIAVSHAVKDFLSHAVPLLSKRIVVVHNGVAAPVEDFPPPLSSATVRLGVIGRLNANKGQDLAIEAVASLVGQGLDVRLEIAGDTFAGAEEYETSLHRLVAELGLADRVTFSGFCPDIWDVLGRTDVVVAPSRTDSLPLVVIEAMLAGRPVVATDVGGMSELLKDGENGLLVGAEDVAALKEGLLLLLDDPSRARRLGANARRTALEHFSVVRFQSQIVENVRATLRSASSPAMGARAPFTRSRPSSTS